jgi:hypothetical protein
MQRDRRRQSANSSPDNAYPHVFSFVGDCAQGSTAVRL